MKNSLLLKFLIIATLFLMSCNDKSYFTVYGTVNGPGVVKKVYLWAADSSGLSLIDSADPLKNKFEFNHTTNYARLYQLRIGSNKFALIAQNGDIMKFETDLINPTLPYILTGSEDALKIREFNSINNLYDDTYSKLSDEYEAKSQVSGKGSDSLMKIFMPRFQKNSRDLSGAILKFVNEHKTSISAFYVAASLDQEKYEEKLVAYAAAIQGAFKDNPDVQRFLKQMEIARPVSVGHKAPEFIAQSINGKQIKLADYRGKYVMLNFWASWCPLCRQENPNVVKQYNLFRSKGLNILGVSLDTEKRDWLYAVYADKLTWTHVSDLQRFEGSTERLYNIQALPSNIIINPEGIIIAKNLTGAELEGFLNKIFHH
jgi:peroxiredoxin